MLFRQTISYFLFSFSGVLAGLITVPFLTRSLSAEEYGYLGLFVTLIYVILPLISFRAEGLVGVNVVACSYEKYVAFRNAYISFALIMFFPLSLVAGLLAHFAFPQYALLVMLTFMIALGRFFTNIHSAELIQARKPNLYGLLNLATTLLVLGATLLFVFKVQASWQSRIIAILMMEWLITAARLLFFSDIAKSFHFTVDRGEIRRIVSFGAPLFVALGLAWIINESDKIIVLNLFSMADLGYYSVAYSIGAFLDRINQAVTNAITPRIYSALNANSGAILLRKYSVVYALVILLIATIASLFFYLFAGNFLGEAYKDSGGLIAIVIFAFAFSGIYKTSGEILNFYKLNILKTKILFYGAAANLIFSLGLIPVFGLLAPAIGTLISFMVTACLAYIYSRKELRARNVSD